MKLFQHVLTPYARISTPFVFLKVVVKRLHLSKKHIFAIKNQSQILILFISCRLATEIKFNQNPY